MKHRHLILAGLLSLGLSLASCNVSNISNGSHKHNFSAKWKYDEVNHWHSCTECDEVTDFSAHDFSEWFIDVQPTDQETGTRHRRCIICGYSYSETMPKVNHVHDWDEPTYTWSYDYSSCTARRECKINRYHYEEEVAESTYEILVSPTADAVGVGRYIVTFNNKAFEKQNRDVRIDKVDVPVTGVTIFPTSLSLAIGGVSILIAEVLPSNASNTKVTWSSSDTSIATVSGGLVTAKALGHATITVTTQEGGFTATCEVTVGDGAVTGVSLSKSSVAVQEGKTTTLSATVSPSNAGNKNVIWSSEDPSIASVSQKGVVTGVKQGNTTIKVTTEEGGFEASCAVQVLERENFSYIIGETVVENYDYVSYSSTTHKIKVYTPITNNGNVNIYISSCTVDIEDSEGNLKDSLSYVKAAPYLIKPGETTYLYDEDTYDGDVFSNLVGIPHPTIKNAKSTSLTRYTVSDITFETNSIYNIQALGRMTNNTAKQTTLPEIAILLFDKNDNFFATLTASIIDDVNPNESISFKATCLNTMYHNDFTISDIGRYEAYAYEYAFVV